MIVRDAAGAQILELGDDVPVDGVTATLYDDSERKFRRVNVESMFVDGDFEVQAVLAGKRISVDVLLTGTWSEMSAKRTALLDAVEARQWILEVAGMQWLCREADSSSPTPPTGPASNWRIVSLSIPVQQQRGI